MVAMTLRRAILPAAFVPGACAWPWGEDASGGARVPVSIQAHEDEGGHGHGHGHPMGVRVVSMGGGMPMGLPGMMLGGMPVMVVRRGGPQGIFGHDPWEDLHHNMERVLAQSAEKAEGTPSRMLEGPAHPESGVPMPLGMQLGSLLDAFGSQHAGHFGRAEGSFQVDDDHATRIRITASLPGYKLGASQDLNHAAESPLAVRVVGKRSLVVKGMQQMGPMIKSWQRTFALPGHGIDLENVAVTYSSSSGNLTVDVPRTNSTDVAPDDGDDKDDDDDDDFLPPALRAMRSGLPLAMNRLEAGSRKAKPRGFLMAGDDPFPDILGQVLGMMDGMHPRNHLPAGGNRPVPEDAEISLIGCYAESQLDKADQKYYGDSNAATFNGMYWHAMADQVPFFAMARHEDPLGHAFTLKGFAHEDEVPQWGVYDGCGVRCEDDESRWCGCSNEGSRGLVNGACAEGEKRFAVYKVIAPATPAPSTNGVTPEVAGGNATAASVLTDAEASPAAATDAGSEAPVTAQTPGAEGAPALSETEPGALSAEPPPMVGGVDQAPPAPEPLKPYWKLVNEGGDEPGIDIVVPKDVVAQARGREVLLYQEGQPDKVTGKVKLPVSVSPEACRFDGRTSDDGGKVFSCKLGQENVRTLPIKVIDEL